MLVFGESMDLRGRCETQVSWEETQGLGQEFVSMNAPRRTSITNPYKSVSSFFMYLEGLRLLSVRCEVLCLTFSGRFDSRLPPQEPSTTYGSQIRKKSVTPL